MRVIDGGVEAAGPPVRIARCRLPRPSAVAGPHPGPAGARPRRLRRSAHGPSRWRGPSGGRPRRGGDRRFRPGLLGGDARRGVWTSCTGLTVAASGATRRPSRRRAGPGGSRRGGGRRFGAVPLDGWSRWIPAWVAIGSLALAGAGWSAGRDLGDPGMTGAVGSILVVLTATALAPRFAWLPNLLGDPARWWWVAAPAAAGAAWWWRDPAARRVRRFRPFPPDGRGGEDVGGPLGSGARDGGPLSPS